MAAKVHLTGVLRGQEAAPLVVNNTIPANMQRWIQQPHAIDEKTAMPETGVTDADARDIAAYLYTLR